MSHKPQPESAQTPDPSQQPAPGGDTAGSQHPLPSQAGSQVERDEIDAGLLGVVGTFIAVVLVLIVVLLQAWFYNWREAFATARSLPATDPSTPLGRALVEQQEQIHGYRWVNREAKVLAIPIERAMELVAKEMAVEQPKPKE